MRSIVSKQKSKNKERFNQIVIGLVLIGVMFLSVLGYSLSGRESEDNGEEKIVYNGFEFVNMNNYWVTKIQDFQFAFKYNPNQVPKISSPVNYLNTYQDLPLYIQSKEDLTVIEIYSNLNGFVERMQEACLDLGNETVCEGDLPVKDCSNNLIIIEESNITSLIQNQSCVFIQGPKEDLVKITDEFLFKILGIE